MSYGRVINTKFPQCIANNLLIINKKNTNCTTD